MPCLPRPRGFDDGEQVVLETEYDNLSSLSLYDSLGFLREKRLHRFYSNMKDACVPPSAPAFHLSRGTRARSFRLILPLPSREAPEETEEELEEGRLAISSGPEEGLAMLEEERCSTEPMKIDERVGTPQPPPRPGGQWEWMYT